MATLPADICNRALDECGLETIGDIQEGSPNANALLRIYEPTLRQLLAAANWNFARKQTSLVLMADANGTYTTLTDVPAPWGYMYEWPTDCVHARWVPATIGNQQTTQDGTIVNTVPWSAWSSPSPFLVTSAPRLNDPASRWDLIEGHDPEQTRVILSNYYGAQLIYTGLMQYPDAWDPLFEQAMVSALAARAAMPLIKDKAFARQIRMDNIQIAKAALDTARVRDGDEGWNVSDHTPDWIRVRTSGIAWSGPGVLYYPWMNVPWLEDAGGVF